MHNYTVNASLQIVPIVQDRHPYHWVDEVISLIQASGIQYEVNAFGTTLQGTYAEVMDVVHNINEYLLQKGCAEWIANLQIQLRSHGDITAAEKTDKYRR